MTSIGILLVIGLLMEFGGKFLPLGHLPGDIHITSEHGSFYFPIVTCVVFLLPHRDLRGHPYHLERAAEFLRPLTAKDTDTFGIYLLVWSGTV